MKIPQEIIEIIRQGESAGSNYQLPSINLDRKIYLQTNEVLESIGLKWSRKNKRHESTESGIAELLEEILEVGEVQTLSEIKKKFQFFETPPEVISRLIELANIKPDDQVLEPSAGSGAIAKEIIKITGKCFCAEIDPIRKKELEGIDGVIQIAGDFLSMSKTDIRPNKIVMNPPFSKSQDTKHIVHAHDMLANCGVLVSVASSTITTRSGKVYDDLRNLNPEIFKLPDGSFKESGTMVNTIILRIQK